MVVVVYSLFLIYFKWVKGYQCVDALHKKTMITNICINALPFIIRITTICRFSCMDSSLNVRWHFLNFNKKSVLYVLSYANLLLYVDILIEGHIDDTILVNMICMFVLTYTCRCMSLINYFLKFPKLKGVIESESYKKNGCARYSNN